MRARSSVLPILLALLPAFTASQITLTASAQVQRGATLTVLRGEVAVVRSNGSAVQPAPSGTTVDSGDEIRTLTRAGALITFFTGTEIEMGEGTILAVDEITRDGDKINVSLKQVLGVTINRVQSLGAPGSSYQIDAGGAVAVVRGTTFALAGPAPTSVGNVVALACLADCSPSSMLGGCAMQPFMGIGVTVDKGKVTSGCETWAVKSSEGYFDAAIQGITTTEQAVAGGNAGQVSFGTQIANSRPVEGNSNRDRDEEREEDNNQARQQAAAPAILLTTIQTPGGTITIALTWSAPVDLDAHLSGPTPTGTRFHASFANRSPVAYVRLDRDVLSGPGTETFTTSTNPATGQFVPGEYRYWVHNFDGTGFPSTLNANVVVSRGGQQLATFPAPTDLTGTQNIWSVFRFTLDSAGAIQITPIQQLLTAPGGGTGAAIQL